MALEHDTEEAWKAFLINAGISETAATPYAARFVEEETSIRDLNAVTADLLTKMDITKIGHQLKILNNGSYTQDREQNTRRKPAIKLKPPEFIRNMTMQKWRVALTDWDVYKSAHKIETSQIPDALYSAGDTYVRNAIHTIPNFRTLSEETLIGHIKELVTEQCNPWVQRIKFADITQNDPGEDIQSYYIRLQQFVPECEFSCPNPNCNQDLSNEHIRHQFIKGLANKQLQADILSKSKILNTLQKVVEHAKSYEAALRDQTAVDPDKGHEGQAARFHISEYRKNKKNPNVNKGSKPRKPKYPNTQYSKPLICRGCKKEGHRPYDRDKSGNFVCKARNHRCGKCEIWGHLDSACEKYPAAHFESSNPPESDNDSKDEDDNNYAMAFANHRISKNPKIITLQIDALLTPKHPNFRGHIPPKTMNIFPDSGASICVAGKKQLAQLGLSIHHLLPCSKRIHAVGGSSFRCNYYIPVEFKIGRHATTQPVYFRDGDIQYLYLSRTGCHDLNILPPSFPYPMPMDDVSSAQINWQPHDAEKKKSTDNGNDIRIPKRPKCIPYDPTVCNIPKLKQYIINALVIQLLITRVNTL